MAVETSAELLGRVSLFVGLSPEQLAAIANKSKKAYFELGMAIVTEGQTGETAYLILSGCATTVVPEGSEGEPEKIEAGALLGEMAMLTETAYDCSVVAEDRVRALTINRSELFEVMETDPSIAQHFADRLLDRLEFLANDLREADAKFAVLELSLDEVLAAVA